MAIMRYREIVNMSSADRAKKLVELRAEVSRLKTMIRAGGAVENPTRVRELRKTIAQLLTAEHEEQTGIRKTEAKEEKPKEKETKKKEKKPKELKETPEKEVKEKKTKEKKTK